MQGNFITQQFHLSGDSGSGTDIILQTATLHYGDTIDQAGSIASETVTAGVMTLFNSGHTAVGTITVGASLNSADFILTTDGSGGTDVILNTVFGTYTSGVTLLTNPTTIANTAKITGSLASGVGVQGPAGTAWTLVNDGTVSETGTASFGVTMASGGTITNAASAVISAGAAGVLFVSGPGSVSNTGSIAGTGTSGVGIRFGGTSFGRSVTNQSGGVITGATDAIYVITGSGAGSVSNSGQITGGTNGFAGINLSGGGAVTNAPGGTITGNEAGVFIYHGTGATVSNAGSIGGSHYGGWTYETATVTNASGGVITGGYTTTSAAGVYLSRGGTVTNQSGGTIGGLRGVYALSGAATVVNAGHIVGSNTTIGAGAANMGAGAYLGAGGAVTNQSGGLITGFVGIFARSAAVTNQSGGTISGVDGVVGYGTGSVLNAGLISGNISSGIGVYLHNGGTVTNQAGGTISGADAVKFAAGFSNRLVFDPGAVFSGSVDGGNVIGGTPISTLELASGASAGTLSSLGTQFINFAQTTVDANANWILSGTNSLVAGATLTNSGTLTDTGTLNNAGTITGNALRLNGGTLTNQIGGLITASYVYGVAAGGADSVVNQGSITDSVGSAIYLKAAGNVSNAATIIATGSVAGDYGVAIQGPGSVSNLGTTALIEGYGGVRIGLDGTVVNAGTIESNQGASGVAVHFSGGNARLIDDPGAVFVGAIYGGNGGTAVLELASGSSAGTITGLGTSVTNFTSLVFDTGAQWTVSGNDQANGLGTLGISGFTSGDTIDLNNFVAVNRTFASNVLTLGDGIGDYQTLHVQGSFSAANFRITNVGSDTDITFQTPPTITAGGTVTFTGGGSAVALDSTLAITDPESTTVVAGTVSFGSGFRIGDTLNFINQNSITGSFDAATGTLSLSGGASVADYQAALDSVTYSLRRVMATPPVKAAIPVARSTGLSTTAQSQARSAPARWTCCMLPRQ